MTATGASPTYFNYDNFEEIQVATAGQDIKQPTGGMGLNMVVKRGTNQFRGMARGYFDNDTLSSSNVPAELSLQGVTPETADHNKQISDYSPSHSSTAVNSRRRAAGAVRGRSS